MVRTLYSKLAIALFGLVCLIGLLFFLLVRYSTEMYQQEVNQKLNATLADNIVKQEQLFSNGKINKTALKQVFHMLMVVNPSIEVYLLDKQGKILDYSAPPEKIKRTSVDLKPIQTFLSGKKNFPIMGDDPRDLNKHKIFSVTSLIKEGDLECYLYIILAGEDVDSISSMLAGSYIARFTIGGVVASLAVALLAGWLIFFLLTRRLSRLSNAINTYARDEPATDLRQRYPVKQQQADEIDQLGQNFNIMADRIDAQLHELKNNDSQRRELIANVSHDLRTPLATLHAYLETLILKGGDISAEERSRYLQIAASHSQRLNLLVDELFELSKLESCETLLNIEPFSLAELVQDVVQKFRLQADGKDIELKTEFGRNLAFAYGDIGLIQRVLENLLENAMRYTPAGGCINVSLVNDSKQIQVKVADTGCGIPAEELPHIFDRFYRLEKSRKGEGDNAGLGLAIVKRIVELHGSIIEATSEINRGTIFQFYLPVRQSNTVPGFHSRDENVTIM
ncbi:MAG: HAMP domain-containing histidine kinase [Gammaproteobacteria bacterium]|nr:HAMP domain-containing histidine kinase [Gammaproteobacteria bacterium]